METVEQLARGYQISQAICVAARLGIADLISSEARTTRDLAAVTGTDQPALGRLLRALAAFGLVREVDGDRFELTAAADSLRADHPMSIRPRVLFWGGQDMWECWGVLYDCVRTGAHARALLSNVEDSVAYREGHPEAAARFHEAMTSRVKSIAAALPDVYDFSRVERIVDIGGGHGYLVLSLLARYPALRGVIFDLPSVAEGARQAVTRAGMQDRCEVVAGDVFEAAPAGADVYLMSRVVHDWPDDRAAAALEKVHDAMKADARLLVIDHILPDSNDVSAAAQAQVLGDLTMLVRTGGRERREAELRELLAGAGLEVTKVASVGFDRSLVEAVRLRP